MITGANAVAVQYYIAKPTHQSRYGHTDGRTDRCID